MSGSECRGCLLAAQGNLSPPRPTGVTLSSQSPSSPSTGSRVVRGLQGSLCPSLHPSLVPPSIPPTSSIQEASTALALFMGARESEYFDFSQHDWVKGLFSSPNPVNRHVFANPICSCIMQIQLSPFLGKLLVQREAMWPTRGSGDAPLDRWVRALHILFEKTKCRFFADVASTFKMHSNAVLGLCFKR